MKAFAENSRRDAGDLRENPGEMAAVGKAGFLRHIVDSPIAGAQKFTGLLDALLPVIPLRSLSGLPVEKPDETVARHVQKRGQFGVAPLSTLRFLQNPADFHNAGIRTALQTKHLFRKTEKNIGENCMNQQGPHLQILPLSAVGDEAADPVYGSRIRRETENPVDSRPFHGKIEMHEELVEGGSRKGRKMQKWRNQIEEFRFQRNLLLSDSENSARSRIPVEAPVPGAEIMLNPRPDAPAETAEVETEQGIEYFRSAHSVLPGLLFCFCFHFF